MKGPNERRRSEAWVVIGSLIILVVIWVIAFRHLQRLEREDAATQQGEDIGAADQLEIEARALAPDTLIDG